jgi:hypothetical protein
MASQIGGRQGGSEDPPLPLASSRIGYRESEDPPLRVPRAATTCQQLMRQLSVRRVLL